MFLLHWAWEIFDTSLAFLDINSKFPSKVTVYASVCTTNPQILIVIYMYCIHLHIHHMSRIPFHILCFLNFMVFVVNYFKMIPTLVESFRNLH